MRKASEVGVKNLSHPELREGEMFLMNVRENEWHFVRYATRRCGEKAYDKFGHLITDELSYPVFIAKIEYEGNTTPGHA